MEEINKAGFDSELKVEHALASQKWSIDQNVYYYDKDEGKGREIDIVATLVSYDKHESQPYVSCRIYLCIEIKKTADPFIFFSSKHRKFERGAGFSTLNWLNNIDNRILKYDQIENKRPMSAPSYLARSYMALKDGKTQQIRAGVLSAVKGAIHFREECNEGYDDHSKDICFFMPILVVDGEIYQCNHEEAGNKLQVQATNELVYVQNYLSEQYGKISSRVYVYTLDRFIDAVSQFDEWATDIRIALMANREKIPKEKLKNLFPKL